jgi:hypothetical protein
MAGSTVIVCRLKYLEKNTDRMTAQPEQPKKKKGIRDPDAYVASVERKHRKGKKK